MGSDIYLFPTKFAGKDSKLVDVPDWDGRSYDLFGWLGNKSRNYCGVPEFPGIKDCAYMEGVIAHMYWEDALGFPTRYVEIDEMLAFDLDQIFEYRRSSVRDGNLVDGTHTVPVGDGEARTYRDLVDNGWWGYLKACKAAGADRLYYYFD